MIKKSALILFLCLIVASSVVKAKGRLNPINNAALVRATDTVPNADVMEVVRLAIYAANDFNIQAVANLYTPNAVVADDEPPYSWNGPTAGIQWINAVEKAVKDYHISKFKGTIESVKV